MFASLARAARLIFDPAFAGIVIKSLLLTIFLFAAALALTEVGLAHLPILGSPLVNRALEWIAPLLFIFGGVLVGPPVAALFASLFLDQVAGPHRGAGLSRLGGAGRILRRPICAPG